MVCDIKNDAVYTASPIDLFCRINWTTWFILWMNYLSKSLFSKIISCKEMSLTNISFSTSWLAVNTAPRWCRLKSLNATVFEKTVLIPNLYYCYHMGNMCTDRKFEILEWHENFLKSIKYSDFHGEIFELPTQFTAHHINYVHPVCNYVHQILLATKWSPIGH